MCVLRTYKYIGDEEVRRKQVAQVTVDESEGTLPVTSFTFASGENEMTIFGGMYVCNVVLYCYSQKDFFK